VNIVKIYYKTTQNTLVKFYNIFLLYSHYFNVERKDVIINFYRQKRDLVE